MGSNEMIVLLAILDWLVDNVLGLKLSLLYIDVYGALPSNLVCVFLAVMFRVTLNELNMIFLLAILRELQVAAVKQVLTVIIVLALSHEILGLLSDHWRSTIILFDRVIVVVIKPLLI